MIKYIEQNSIVTILNYLEIKKIFLHRIKWILMIGCTQIRQYFNKMSDIDDSDSGEVKKTKKNVMVLVNLNIYLTCIKTYTEASTFNFLDRKDKQKYCKTS